MGAHSMGAQVFFFSCFIVSTFIYLPVLFAQFTTSVRNNLNQFKTFSVNREFSKYLASNLFVILELLLI